MWIAVNCLLLMLGAVLIVVGIGFFLRTKDAADRMSLYILLYALTSAVWCISYGIIGITDNFELAYIVRRVGVFAIDSFFVVEVFFVSRMCNTNKTIRNSARILGVVLSAADFIGFSGKNIDIFVRIGNWTTWFSNPETVFNRTMHSVYVVLVFLLTFSLGLVWAATNKLKRQRKFIAMCFVANFILLFFSAPDTLMPALHLFAIPTSGIGAAGCSLVLWYAATQLNSFDISMGNIVRNLYDFIDVGVVVFDTDHHMVMLNPYARNLLPEGEIGTNMIGDLFSINGVEEKDAFEQSRHDIYNMDRKGRNGKTYSIRMNAVMDDFKEPYCYLCIFMDVSEKVDLINRLEDANNAKTDFLTSISHEIRTPINAIVGFNEMILRETDDPEISEYTSNIDRAARHLLTIINDLLDMEQIKTGKFSINLDQYDLKNLLQSVYVMHEIKVKEKGLTLDMSCNENIPNYLFGDSVRIQQVVINLLTNAIKYTAQGGVSLQADYRPIDSEMIELILRVADTGIGIRDKDLPHVYELFERFDKDKNKLTEGTGVGLSLVKNIVEAMDGKITVESRYGVGTCFTVRIPQKVIDYDPIGEQSDEPVAYKKKKAAPFIAPNASILIVDDNEMNRVVAAGLLKQLKVSIDQAPGGYEMLEMIKKKHYDIIFLDHLMPRMDGIEALRWMRLDKDHPNQDTPVIAMTANAIRGMSEKYMEAGFTDYLFKPVEPKKFTRMVERYLDEDLIEYIRSPKNDPVDEAKAEIMLPQIDGVDWDTALASSSEIGMVKELVRTFVRSASGDMKNLDSYYESLKTAGLDDETVSPYRVKVHALKNSAALVGATALSDKARALEYAASDADLQFILENHGAFRDEYLSLAQAFKDAGLGDDEGDAPMDYSTLAEQISRAKNAMDSFDTATLNELTILFTESAYSNDEVGDLVAKLCEAIKNFDRDAFSAVIEKIEAVIA